MALHWLGRTRPVLDEPRRHAGWAWLRRQSQAWPREQEAAIDDTLWPNPVESPGGYGCWGEPVTSGLGLWRKARAMHHYVDRFADDCAAGNALVLSMSPLRRRDKCVATALLKRSGRVRAVAQLHPFANRDPGEDVVQAVRDMVHHLTPL